MLDADTLRPWRVLEGFEARVRGIWANERVAVVNTREEVLAVDLRSTRPSQAASSTPAERLASLVEQYESGELGNRFELGERIDEFAAGGEAIVPALVMALESDSEAARALAGMVLATRPSASAVPALLVAAEPSASGTGEEASTVQASLLRWARSDATIAAYSALAASGDPRATELLGRVFGNDDIPEAWGIRDLALYGLTAIGTPEALGPIDARRRARAARAEPWYPPVAEAITPPDADPLLLAILRERGIELPGAIPERPLSVRVVSGVAGGGWDIWAFPDPADPASALFTGIGGLGPIEVESIETSSDRVRFVVRRQPCTDVRSCRPPERGEEGSEAREPPRTAEETAAFRWAELRRDRDRDGWTDLLERRLRTDPAKKDSDGDTLDDPLDPAPRGAGPAEGGCTQAQALSAAFFAEHAFLDRTEPIFVVGPATANVQYEAGPAVAIYLSTEESGALREEIGWGGPEFFLFRHVDLEAAGIHFAGYVYRPGAGEAPPEPGRPAFHVGEWPEGLDAAEEGTDLSIDVEIYWGPLTSTSRRIVLRCLGGRWYPRLAVTTGMA